MAKNFRGRTGGWSFTSASAWSRPAGTGQAAPEPVAGPRCDASQPRGKHADYAGGSVSALYDQVFHPGIALPYLDDYIPQALSTWTDWDGAGHTLLLLGMYRDGHESYLVGLDPDTGRAIGTIVIEPSPWITGGRPSSMRCIHRTRTSTYALWASIRGP